MSRVYTTITALGCLLGASTAFAGGDNWVNLVEDSGRIVAAPGLVENDGQEKDYAWGDIDGDGDEDLVIARKQPFTSTGKQPNVLLINQGGVLIDRTADFASASDVPGDQGFLTPTNDRDVVLVDVNNDGWLDLVTATTLTDNQAKHLSHPRVYMNLGDDNGGAPPLDGNWLGLEYQDARIPEMHPTAGPRFCSVAAGDVTGDGYADLYFGDYDSGGAQIFDYNNKLLINQGAGNPGFFVDESNSRLTSQMRQSAFGAASAIADMNGDDVMDVVKQTSLGAPTHVAVTYNDPANEGFFNAYDTVYNNSPYFISVGDLDNDTLLDILVTDDGTDRILINQGNGGDGLANFQAFQLPSITGGFGGNSLIVDLNKDGFQDIIITDVDVDIPGCGRTTKIMRNLGGNPVSFQQQGAVIPLNQLNGVHDMAAMDIDGDTWVDLVVGRCGGTQVYMNQPAFELAFVYPSGLPQFVPPGDGFTIAVNVQSDGGSPPEPGTGMLHYSLNGAGFVSVPMTQGADNEYTAQLPATNCTDRIDYYVSAEDAATNVLTDPPGAPSTTFQVVAALNVELALRDELEADVSGWTVVNDAGLDAGGWEHADPNGTISSVFGMLAAPPRDATAGEAVFAFVTENGPPGGDDFANDIDGGPTHLITPVLDVAGTDGVISYARWFFCDDIGTAQEDVMTVSISNDGGANWVPVPDHTVDGTGSIWETTSLIVSQYVLPTATVQLRFTVQDEPNDSVTEAGIDNLQLDTFVCEECLGDLDGSGGVATTDLLQLLAAWGPCALCPEDLDGDGTVGTTDLLDLLAQWGSCP